MFIRVTNISPNRLGDPIVINVNSIVSVYEDHFDGGSLRTVIYASDNLIWYVEESLEKVFTLMKAAVDK